MLNKRRDAAIKVAKGLFALEKAIDDALIQCAELHALMPAARAQANLSAVVGQEAFEGAAAVFAALAEARHHVVHTHRMLDETKDRLGLRTLAFGGADKDTSAKGALTLVEVGRSEAA